MNYANKLIYKMTTFRRVFSPKLFGVLLIFLTILPITAEASSPSLPIKTYQVSVQDWYCGTYTTPAPNFASALAVLFSYTNGCSVAGPVTVDTSGTVPHR